MYDEREAETAVDARVSALGRALDRLKTLDPEMVQAIDLRYVNGISAFQAMQTLALPRRAFELRWYVAMEWLDEFLVAEGLRSLGLPGTGIDAASGEWSPRSTSLPGGWTRSRCAWGRGAAPPSDSESDCRSRARMGA